MPNMYGGNIGFGPYGAEQSEALRKQRLSEMLMKQGMQPIQPQQGGRFAVPISPLQGLAQVGTAAAGGMLGRKADEQAAGIAQKQQAERAQALSRALQQAQGSPQPDASMGGGPAMPADPVGAMGTLAQSQDPTTMQMGAPAINMQQQQMRQQQEQAFRAQQAQQAQQDRSSRESASRQQQEDMARLTASLRATGDRPYFQFLDTPQGIARANARTGEVGIAQVGGQPIMKSASDPDLQGQIAGSKKAAQEGAEAQTQAAVNLPQTIAKGEMAVKQIDDLLKHPGFSSTVGFTMMPGMRFVEGSNQADFMARLDQLKGGAFLQAFETLKGGGQITEIEGRKATDAITRMNKSQSEKEFKSAAEEFKSIIQAGVERAKIKASGGSFGRRANDNAPAPGTVMQGYRFKGGNPADRSN